jgi:hypothetical protein
VNLCPTIGSARCRGFEKQRVDTRRSPTTSRPRACERFDVGLTDGSDDRCCTIVDREKLALGGVHKQQCNCGSGIEQDTVGAFTVVSVYCPSSISLHFLTSLPVEKCMSPERLSPERLPLPL